MTAKEILDYLTPILEEDEEQFLIEVEFLSPKIKMGEIFKHHYNPCYKSVIKRIAEIRGENIYNFIY